MKFKNYHTFQTNYFLFDETGCFIKIKEVNLDTEENDYKIAKEELKNGILDREKTLKELEEIAASTNAITSLHQIAIQRRNQIKKGKSVQTGRGQNLIIHTFL